MPLSCSPQIRTEEPAFSWDLIRQRAGTTAEKKIESRDQKREQQPETSTGRKIGESMMSNKLTLAEQETIILWDNELNTVSIYTHDPRMLRRLAELSEKYPDDFILEKNGAGKSRFYRLPKKLIAIRNPYSEERRKKQREQALLENYRERFTENNETSGREEAR